MSYHCEGLRVTQPLGSLYLRQSGSELETVTNVGWSRGRNSRERSGLQPLVENPAPCFGLWQVWFEACSRSLARRPAVRWLGKTTEGRVIIGIQRDL